MNKFLDSLPRPRLTCLGREVPTFRSCGIAGFYLALIISIGAVLLNGRSPVVFAVLALVSALSFFAYAHFRKWITGHENLVLLEHVWFALACNAGALWLMRQPLLPYLDVVSIGLCFFLAAGRIGCTLVGCCHGHPSSFGIAYNEACATDGFPRHLVGIRLFPVPALEAVGLVVIGGSGLFALPFAGAGKVFIWYLLAYSVMRFGLEGMRGDHRPHFLGLSQARWMAMIEVGFALGLVTPVERAPVLAILYLLTLSLLIVMLAVRWQRDWRRRLLAVWHCREVRELTLGEIENDAFDAMKTLSRCLTSQSVCLAFSRAESGQAPSRDAHVSLSLPAGQSDLWLLCELAARAFPELVVEYSHLTSGRVLHLIVRTPEAEVRTRPEESRKLAEQLYGRLARYRQQADEKPRARRNGDQRFREPPTQPIVPNSFSPNLPTVAAPLVGSSSWCFSGGKNKAG